MDAARKIKLLRQLQDVTTKVRAHKMKDDSERGDQLEVGRALAEDDFDKDFERKNKGYWIRDKETGVETRYKNGTGPLAKETHSLTKPTTIAKGYDPHGPGGPYTNKRGLPRATETTDDDNEGALAALEITDDDADTDRITLKELLESQKAKRA